MESEMPPNNRTKIGLEIGVEVQNITILYQGPKQYKIEILEPYGLSRKGKGPNLPIKDYLK